MKKILFTVALIAATVSVSAQSMRFGVKGGLNISNLTSADKEFKLNDETGRMGYHIGFMSEFKFDRFAVQPELLYSAQGNKYVDSSGLLKAVGGDSSVVHQLDYVTIPLMFKFYVIEGLAVEAGPQFAYNVVDKIVYNGKEFDLDDNEELDDPKKLDYGLNFGASYTLSSLNIGARYCVGFAEMGLFKQKNSVFQISLGYLF